MQVMSQLLLPLLVLIPLTSCATPQWKDYQTKLGKLELRISGCAITDAVFTNTSSRDLATTFNQVLVAAKNRETAWSGEINCHPVVAGGKSQCIVRPWSVERRLCGNWGQIQIRSSGGGL